MLSTKFLLVTLCAAIASAQEVGISEASSIPFSSTLNLPQASSAASSAASAAASSAAASVSSSILSASPSLTADASSTGSATPAKTSGAAVRNNAQYVAALGVGGAAFVNLFL